MRPPEWAAVGWVVAALAVAALVAWPGGEAVPFTEPEVRQVVSCPPAELAEDVVGVCPASWHPPMPPIRANEARREPERMDLVRHVSAEGDTSYYVVGTGSRGAVDTMPMAGRTDYPLTLIFDWLGEPAFCTGRCAALAPEHPALPWPAVGVEAATILGLRPVQFYELPAGERRVRRRGET